MTKLLDNFLKCRNKKEFLTGCDAFKICSLSKEIRSSDKTQISTKSLLFLLQSLISGRKGHRNEKQLKYFKYELISLIARFLPKLSFNAADPKSLEIFVDLVILCTTTEYPCEKHARPSLEFKDLMNKDKSVSEALSRIGNEFSLLLPAIAENDSSRLWTMFNLLNETQVVKIDHGIILSALKKHFDKETTFSQVARLLLHSELTSCSLDNWRELLQMVRKTESIESVALLLDTILIQIIKKPELKKVLAEDSFHRVCLSLLTSIRLEKVNLNQKLYVIQGATALLSILVTSIPESERKVGDLVFKSLINSLVWLFSIELSLDLDPPVKFSTSKYELSFLLSVVKPKFLQSILELLYVQMKTGDPCSPHYSGLLSICLSIFHFISLYPANPDQVLKLSVLLSKVMNCIGADFIQEVRPQSFAEAALDLCILSKNMLLGNQGATAEALMRLLITFISHKRSRTALSDEGAVSLFLDQEISVLVLGSSELLQNSPRLMVLTFLENAAKDSAVRFKMKEESILFFIRLIEASVSGNNTYLDNILRRSLLFLNEHFGFDSKALHFFSIQENDRPALLFNLLDMLLSSCRLQLNLECEDYIYSPETNLAAVHTIDSIFRTEKGKNHIVDSCRIGDLSEIATTTNHTKIPSIILKILSRILTDQALTMRLSLTRGFSRAFERLKGSSLVIVEETIALHKSELLVPLLSLFDYSSENELHTAIAILHVAPKELINSLITPHQNKNPISRSKSLAIWGQLFVAYQTGLDGYAQAAMAYAKSKIAFQRVPRVIKPLEIDSILIQNLFDGQKVLSLLEYREGLLEFPFADKPSLYLPKTQFMNASKVFKAMIEDPFEESQSNRIVIKDVDHEQWYLLLSFITLSQIDNTPQNAQSEFARPTTLDELEIVYTLIALADKFDIPTLHQALINYLKDCLHYCSAAKQESQILSIFCFLKKLEGFEFSGKERVELLHLAAFSLLGSF